MNNLGKIKIADDVAYEDYEQGSIETFGKNMLYKMGWKDNQPLKKNGPVDPIQFKIRNSGLGLGAELVEEEKKVKNKKVNYYGTKVKIRSGKHKGLKGKLVDRDIDNLNAYLRDKKYVSVELKINKKIAKIECEYIKIRKEVKKYRSKSNSKSSSKSSHKSNSNDDLSKNNLKPISRSNSPALRNNKNNKQNLQWVQPNIIVRIVTKKSKYYNCKAVVEDKLDLYSFSLLILDDKTIHTEFTEEDIETYIPKINSDILILTGEHKGEIAKLLLRDKSKNLVNVQLLTDLSIVSLTQDDVSAYFKFN